MNTIRLAGLASLSLLAIAASTGMPANAQKRKTPETLVSDWTKAFTANKAELLLKFYEQSEELEVRMSNGTRYEGYEQLKQVYELDFATVKFSKSLISAVKSREIRDVAVVSFVHQFQFQIEDEAEYAGHVQTVMVLRKSDGDWKIINEHSSPLKDIPRLRVK